MEGAEGRGVVQGGAVGVVFHGLGVGLGEGGHGGGMERGREGDLCCREDTL